MSSNDYNPDHWKEKIPKYLAEQWSNRPSPFVQIAAKYFKPNAKVLELGTGAGQDGMWLNSKGYEVVMTDGDDIAFDQIKQRANSEVDVRLLDLTNSFPFEDSSFDAVYSQLVLHYFDDEMMHSIIQEIKRVLKPGGVLACMVNSTSDPEYDEKLEDSQGLINVGGLIKRYFTVETFKPFVKDFEPTIFDTNGRTPKDDAVKTSGMIQFIGSLK